MYGRDASDAQLLAKTARFLFYRDSGPTLALTRRQQVEHEAYLTLMADRAGARVPTVLAAGPAGPARDALLVTRPPPGRRLSTFAAYVLPGRAGGSASDHGDPATPRTGAQQSNAGSAAVEPRPTPRRPGHADAGNGSEPAGTTVSEPVRPVVSDAGLDAIFAQLSILRRAGIAHGALSIETIVVDDDDRAGFVDFRTASTAATATSSTGTRPRRWPRWPWWPGPSGRWRRPPARSPPRSSSTHFPTCSGPPWTRGLEDPAGQEGHSSWLCGSRVPAPWRSTSPS